jgi:hypothetical protein
MSKWCKSARSQRRAQRRQEKRVLTHIFSLRDQPIEAEEVILEGKNFCDA